MAILSIKSGANKQMNEYVRWTKEDEGIYQVGVLIRESDTDIILLTKHGEFTLPKTDGNFEYVTHEEYDQSSYPTHSSSVKKSSGTDSKMSKAIAIYNKMKENPRKDVLIEFIVELGMSDSCASTYYQNIKSKQK